MQRYLLRYNVEYSLEVDAPSETAALKVGDETDLCDWTQAASCVEVELDGPSPVVE